MFRFSLLGFPVEVQPFFWVTMAILGGAAKADSAEAILGIITFILAGFVSILVHELGHALTARRFGANVYIVIEAFGGYAAYSGVRMSRKQSFLITAGGPAIQIALGVISLLLLKFGKNMNDNLYDFTLTLMVISFFWAILNLLPILPLDGGRLLDAVLGPSRIKITLWTTIVTAVGIGGAMLIHDPENFIFPIFLGMFAYQAFKALQENRWR